MAMPGKSISSSLASDSSRSISNMPPCTMPNSAFGFSPRWNSSFERCAQRKDMRIDLAASSMVAGRSSISYGVHSSNCMTMSEFKTRCTCIDTSGERNSLSPLIGELKCTPSSVILRMAPSENTWKPPESVKIGLFQPMKPCKPPNFSMTVLPGRNHK